MRGGKRPDPFLHSLGTGQTTGHITVTVDRDYIIASVDRELVDRDDITASVDRELVDRDDITASVDREAADLSSLASHQGSF